MRIKLLICLLLSLSICSANSALASNDSKKSKTYQKKSGKSKKTKASKKSTEDSTSNVPAISEEKLSTIEYKCDESQKFNILGKIESDNNITINFEGAKVILTRVDTDTGANRFVNQDKGFDLVHMPSKSMLMNTKIGRRLADNCHAPSSLVSAEQNSAYPDEQKNSR